MRTPGTKKRRRLVLAKLREVLAKAKRDALMRPKVSAIFASIAEGPAEDVITVGEFVAVLDRRAFGVVLLLLGMISVIPLPPGVSSLVGVPILFFGFQLLLGWHRPWLPAFLRRRTFTRAHFGHLLYVSERYLKYVESFCWPRLPLVAWFVSPYLVGAVVVVLSLYIMAPIPFVGVLPSIVVVVLALALIEGDGLILLVGLFGAAFALFISTTLATGALFFIVSAIGRFLGA